jgi:hypothetical protein
MTDIWIVIDDARHDDIEAVPFSSEERAVEVARDYAGDMSLPEGVSPDEVEHVPGERELTSRMIEDGWVFFAVYSMEGDSVRVVKRSVDDTERLR